MGIKTIMITGDNPMTAAAIAAEAGVDDFLAEARPEDKLALIRRYQEAGKLVAMTGDGTNDAPAPGPGRRRGGDEQRHPGGERGGQHGRPGFRSGQIAGGGRGRPDPAGGQEGAVRRAGSASGRQQHGRRAGGRLTPVLEDKRDGTSPRLYDAAPALVGSAGRAADCRRGADDLLAGEAAGLAR